MKVTLKQWKQNLRSGMQLRCTYRWYWGTEKPAPEGGELCTILHTKATQMIYSTPSAPRSYMQFPKASELNATETGFELYFPVDPKLSNPVNGPDRSGKLVSRYEYVA